MRATGDKVFILPEWDVEEKSGSIFLPKMRIRDLPCQGVVKSMGERVVADFRTGDRVVYDRHKSQMVNVPGEPETLVFVKSKDVMAVYDSTRPD